MHSIDRRQLVLEQLAQTPVRLLCDKSTVRDLYESSREVKLLTRRDISISSVICSHSSPVKGSVPALHSTALSRLEQLHALFNVALDNGLVSLVAQFAEEVVMDEWAVSSDDIQAELLDGDHVLNWVSGERWRLADSLFHADKSNLGLEEQFTLFSPDSLNEALVLFRDLEHVLAPMQSTLSANRERVQEELNQLRLLYQHCQALLWCTQVPLARAGSYGRHAGLVEWKSECGRRRQSLLPLTSTCVDDLLTRLGRSREVYPPESAQTLVRDLFRLTPGRTTLESEVPDDMFTAKKKLLLYLFLDLGCQVSELASHFQRSMRLAPAVFQEVQVSFLLDSAVGPAAEDVLDAACRLAPTLAIPSADFKVVRLLHVRGRPGAALSVLRALPRPSHGEAGSEEASLEQGEAGLCVRLECGLYSEAFVAMREHCKKTPEHRRAETVNILMSNLAEECERTGQLAWLVSLPLNREEEQALHSWLQNQEGSITAEFLPMFYLNRARFVEAVEASQQGSSAALSLAGCARAGLVEEARRALPQALQRLTTTDHNSDGPPIQITTGVIRKVDGCEAKCEVRVNPWGASKDPKCKHPAPLRSFSTAPLPPSTPPQLPVEELKQAQPSTQDPASSSFMIASEFDYGPETPFVTKGGVPSTPLTAPHPMPQFSLTPQPAFMENSMQEEDTMNTQFDWPTTRTVGLTGKKRARIVPKRQRYVQL